MENRRLISLRGVLLGYLVQCAVFCLLTAVMWVTCLLALIWTGVALPANAAAAACTRAVQQVSALTAEQVTQAELDPLCRYVVFAGEDSARPQYSNMDEKHLQRAMEYWHGQTSPRWGYAQYYLRADLAEGGVCLFQFDYAMPYADPALRERLPDLQTMHCALGLLLLAGVIALCTRRAGRFLSAETARLTEASRQVAAQQLDAAAFTGARVREYAQALGALQQMGSQLTDSLQAQWRMEQQRAGQVAALAHDLKTPLSIIQGNAELLAEDALTPPQQEQTQAILRGAQRAGLYLEALRVASAPSSARKKVDSHALLCTLAQTGRGLCTPAGVKFCLQEDWQGRLCASEAELCRAVENLLDNGVRHTPKGGQLTLGLRREEKHLVFWVEDGGPGFTPEALVRAGEFLYTEASRTDPSHQGLGLYFARQVAQAHGGRLVLRNTLSGACAELWLTAEDTPKEA